MRELYMKSGQGFLLVFSITSRSSLHELNELREQLVNLKDDPEVPIVLVGNKSDLEEDRQVSRAAAFAVSQQWGNVPYYETSARRRANVNEVFVDVCRQIIQVNEDRLKALEELRRKRRYGGHGDGGGGGDWDERDEARPRRRKGKRRRTTPCTIL